MTTRIFKTVCTVLGLSGAAILASGCQNSNMLAEQSFRGSQARYHAETGELYRIYDYYPNDEVYYSPFQDLYFYQDEHNEWRHSTFVPSHVTLAPTSVELIEVASGRPYEFHEDVLAQHPTLAGLRAHVAEITEQDEADGVIFASVPTD